jgi:hypothetical protein
MPKVEPVAKLEPQFSSPDASPTPWQEAKTALETAPVYWLSTVKPDGKPHVTPVAGLWFEDAFVFATGPTERKALNLADNPACVVTTGTNSFDDSLDIVVEGEARRLTDGTRLRRLTGLYDAKYAPMFHFEVRDGAFHGDGGEAWVYEVRPAKAFGFGRQFAEGGEATLEGGVFSQTRWRFTS